MKKICVVLAAFSMFALCACTPSSMDITFEEVSSEEETETVEETEEETSTLEVAEETESGSCFVYVCGAVASPGVYELPAGSRAYEALELAGGALDDAASTAINLAEEVYDGEQLYVPTWDEYNSGWEPETSTAAAETVASGESSALININTATKEELMTLNGIGEARAEAIIAYREENGSFSQIEDIMLVSGIKDAAFEKIKDYITVE